MVIAKQLGIYLLSVVLAQDWMAVMYQMQSCMEMFTNWP
jgi:hypothetical protein